MSCETTGVHFTNHVAYPERSHTQSGYTNDEADNSYPFIPGCVCQRKMMFVGAGTVQNLAYQTQDIDCRDHDG